MIVPAREHGRMRPEREGEVRCIFADHVHVGDEIERELEMIICAHHVEQVFRNLLKPN